MLYSPKKNEVLSVKNVDKDTALNKVRRRPTTANKIIINGGLTLQKTFGRGTVMCFEFAAALRTNVGGNVAEERSVSKKRPTL